MPRISDAMWTLEAHKLAKLCARLHIENCNPQAAAKALADLPYDVALEYAYELGFTYHRKQLHDRAEAALAASALIERPQHNSEVHEEHWHKYKKEAPRVRRHLPVDILSTPL